MARKEFIHYHGILVIEIKEKNMVIYVKKQNSTEKYTKLQEKYSQKKLNFLQS